MYTSSVRSTMATPVKTALRLVAILSVLLSPLGVARPAIANHEDGPAVTQADAPVIGSLLVRKTDDGDPAVPLEGAEFTVSGVDGTFTSDENGWFCVDGLTFGEEYTVTETMAPDGHRVDVDNPQVHTIDDVAACEERAIDPIADLTFVNVPEHDEQEGTVEIDKLFCFTDDGAGTEFFVFGPIFPEPLEPLGAVEVQPPDGGCWSEDVSFSISGGDLAGPIGVSTGDDGSVEIDLTESVHAYLITEDTTGESAEFFVEDGALTAIVVLNLVEQEEDTGLLKVIKLFCEGDAASVEFSVEAGDVPVPAISGCAVGDATFELGDETFSIGADGTALLVVEVGEYRFAEVAPNQDAYDGTIIVGAGEFTTIIVNNTFDEGEEPGGGGPVQNETPREGTQGGNPLPNTATSPIPTGSVPAALLALVMLSGLGVAADAVRAEARRRS